MGCSSAQNPSIVPISLGVQIVLKAHFTSLVKFMGRYFIFIIIVSLYLSELTLEMSLTLLFVHSIPATLAPWLSWNTSATSSPRAFARVISFAWYSSSLSYFFTMSLTEPHIFLL